MYGLAAVLAAIDASNRSLVRWHTQTLDRRGKRVLTLMVDMSPPPRVSLAAGTHSLTTYQWSPIMASRVLIVLVNAGQAKNIMMLDQPLPSVEYRYQPVLL